MASTKIEWADTVWNVVTGCSHAGSPACDHCYARRMSRRLKGRYGYPADNPFRVTFHPDRLDEPLRWRTPRMVFVVSMGDLFHEDVKKDWIDSVWSTMAEARQHTFQVLTKRPERMREYILDRKRKGWKPDWNNIWLGVTVEDQARADERIPILLQIPAAVRFVSVEPMLGTVQFAKVPGFNLSGQAGVDLLRNFWVICGAETSNGARYMDPAWPRALLAQCRSAGVPFFMKKMSKGMSIPEDLMVREFPNV